MRATLVCCGYVSFLVVGFLGLGLSFGDCERYFWHGNLWDGAWWRVDII